MKTPEAKAHLLEFIHAVCSKYGRAHVQGGHSEEIIARERITVLWMDGEKAKCIGYYKTRCVGRGEFKVTAQLYDTPRPAAALPVEIRCAMQTIQTGEPIAMLRPFDNPAHGWN